MCYNVLQCVALRQPRYTFIAPGSSEPIGKVATELIFEKSYQSSSPSRLVTARPRRSTTHHTNYKDLPSDQEDDEE